MDQAIKCFVSNMKKPKITLLTCTHNGEQTIEKALEAIALQTDVPRDIFEVLIIDNASSDRTSEIAADAIERWNLDGRVVPEPKIGKINAFLTGMKEARGEFISIIDDDNYLKPGFIRYTLNVFDRYPQVGMVGSSNSILSDQPLPSWFLWTCGYYACSKPWLDEPQTDSEGIVVSPTAFVPGAGSTFRAQSLRDCLDRGYSFFNNTLRGKNMTVTGEDLEVCCLLSSTGQHFAYDPRIQIDHAIPPSRLSLDYFTVLCRTMGAGSLGIDPFLFTYKVEPQKWLFKWTWQWQLMTKLKLYISLSILQVFRNFNEQQRFLNWRERVKCMGAIRRILAERQNYTQHIRQVASGEWTELRIR
jgi:glycosyltransferase involved in cell wall biosynthesis